ncbi:MAG: HAD family hydrolase [Candidatus Merdivicinus sp.]|jgi:Cof subfamily protein (haloacid dehalogenase superfamily)
MPPSYRMLATDLDGTLFTTQGTVSPGNRDAIRRATERGIPIILCSGRSPAEGVAALGEELGLNYPGNCYICCSGAMMVDAASLAILEGNYLPLDAAIRLIGQAAAFPERLRPQRIRLCTTQAVYYRSPAAEYRYEARFGLKLLPLPEDLRKIQGEITKLLFLSDQPNYAFDFIRRMEPDCPPEALGYIMPPSLAEYVGADARKGHAVVQLAARLGISMEEVICVGDGFNDISMLEDAGLGIAVRNAEESVRQKADLVLDASNNEDAIQKIIDGFLL